MRLSILRLLLAGLMLSAWPLPSMRMAVAMDRIELAQNAAISRDQAARIAQSSTGGRVLSVDYQGRGGGSWRVKVLLPDRRVRTIVVDAQSGAVRG
ncbi:MAG: PepSY domain-containing protein [Pseudomonadota bacterium]